MIGFDIQGTQDVREGLDAVRPRLIWALDDGMTRLAAGLQKRRAGSDIAVSMEGDMLFATVSAPLAKDPGMAAAKASFVPGRPRALPRPAIRPAAINRDDVLSAIGRAVREACA